MVWATPTPFSPSLIPASSDGGDERCECPRIAVVPGIGMWCPDCHNIRNDRLHVDTREPAFSEDRGAGPPPAKRCYLRQGGKRQAQQRQLRLAADSSESAGKPRAGRKRQQATKRDRSAGDQAQAQAPPSKRQRVERAPKPPKEPPKPRERKPRTRPPRAARQPPPPKPPRDGTAKRGGKSANPARETKAPVDPTAAGMVHGKGVAEAAAGMSPEAVKEAERMYGTFREHPQLASASRKRLRGVLLACLYRAAMNAGCGFNLAAARRLLNVSSHSVNDANLVLCEIAHEERQGASEDSTLTALVRAAVQRLAALRSTDDESKKGIDTDRLVACAQFARRSCPELNGAHARSVCAATIWVFAGKGDMSMSERAVCEAAEVSPETLKRYARFLAAAVPGRMRIAAAIGL